jgi:hypothetical protein
MRIIQAKGKIVLRLNQAGTHEVKFRIPKLGH